LLLFVESNKKKTVYQTIKEDSCSYRSSKTSQGRVGKGKNTAGQGRARSPKMFYRAAYSLQQCCALQTSSIEKLSKTNTFKNMLLILKRI
jgi:hypothetical protein